MAREGGVYIMNARQKSTTNLLDGICRICPAHWAAFLKLRDGLWTLTDSAGLNRSSKGHLLHFVAQPAISGWISGGMQTRRMRHRSLKGDADSLGSQQVYLFCASSSERALLVGSDGLTGQAQELLRLVVEHTAHPPLQDRAFPPTEVDQPRSAAQDGNLALIDDLLSQISRFCDQPGSAQRSSEKLIALLHSPEASEWQYSYLLEEALVNLLSNTLQNAKRKRQLEDEAHQRRVVHETALDIIADYDLDILLHNVVRRAKTLLHAPGAELGLLEADGQSIRLEISDNPWESFKGLELPVGEGLAGQVLLTGQTIRVKDYEQWEYRLKSAPSIPFRAAIGTPLLFKGEVIGVLIVMDDHPEREFTEDDLKSIELLAPTVAIAIRNAELYDELQQRSEAQRQAESLLVQSEKLATTGRLMASIAHEINNPLQALHNCLYLADHSELEPAERSRYLAMARSELDRLVNIAQRMLDFYRPTARDRQSTDLNHLVLRTMALVKPQLQNQAVEGHLELGQDLPKVLVVADQIQQVLLNLILNAVQAMPQGGKLIIRTARCEVPPSGRRRKNTSMEPRAVEIIVRDSGYGVAQQDRERIFDPFVSTKDGGLGLGLPVSYGIIQAHGGSLSLVVDEQPGACFRIIIPEDKI